MATLWDYVKFLGSIAVIITIFIVVITTIYHPPTGYVTASYNSRGSCRNSCGGPTLTQGGNCFCDDQCYSAGDCCRDIKRYCS